MASRRRQRGCRRIGRTDGNHATIATFLNHARVEKGLSPNTTSAYRRDLVKFDEFAKKRKLSLETVTATPSSIFSPLSIAKSSNPAPSLVISLLFAISSATLRFRI